MKQVLCLFLIIFLFCTTNVFAARYYDPNEILALPTTSGPTFYVAKTGSDSNSGTSLEDAWLTMGKAMFAYKDRTSAGKGIRVIVYPGIYRERWSIPNSWTASTSESNRIYIVGSGTGETIFDSGMIADSWSVHYDSIYKSKITNPIDTGMPADLTAVVIDDDMYSYHPQDHLVDVEEEGDWYYDTGTGTLYLWVLLAKGDPSDDDVVIVEDHGGSSGRYTVAFRNHVDYATIQDVTIRGSAAFGTFDYQNNNHNNIKHCKIQWNAKGGILMSHASYNVYEKNLIQGNIIRNWPRGKWNSTCAHINAGGWPQSLGGPSNDHTTISGNIVRDGGGEGLGGSRGVGYSVVYDNIVYNNWSFGIYFDNNANNIIRNNYVYVDRVFTSADISNRCSAGDEANRVLRRCRQEGIGTANEVYSGWGAESSDNSIFNNVIVNCRVGITHYGEHVDSGLKNAKIYQNTIIVPDVDGSSISDAYKGFSFTGDVDDTGSTIYNNIVYSRNSNNLLVKWNEAITAGIVWDYNIWYAPDNATPFRFDGIEYNFVDWKAQTSGSTYGTNVDPDLQSLSSSQDADNYRPNIGSVSLSGGKVLVPPYDTDFNYVAKPTGTGWSRGALGTVEDILQYDIDGDGYEFEIDDCDDTNALINPGEAEGFDGIDNNCDGVIDEGFTDADGDGYAFEIDDCDDGNASVNPGETEILNNGIDDDCDSVTPDTFFSMVDFNDNSILPYGLSGQDVNSTVTIDDSGATLRIFGNGWKKIRFPYTVTANTILEFDFQSTAEGEVHGIGFDNDDNIFNNTTKIFKLHGTQSWGIQAFNNYDGEIPKHYAIPVGQYYAGDMLYICFANDHDVVNPVAESIIKNISVYEQAVLEVPPVAIDDVYEVDEAGVLNVSVPGVLLNDSDANSDLLIANLVSGVSNGVLVLNANGDFTYTPNLGYTGIDIFTYKANDGTLKSNETMVTINTIPTGIVTVDFDANPIQPYGVSGQDVNSTVSIEDGGSTLRIVGNGWKKMAFPYTVTANTILEFDYQSTVEGEVHGIGLDNDDNIFNNPTKIFELHGTQGWGIQSFKNYAGESSKHFIIPVGQYYTGDMVYICFANDHDVVNPSAESVMKDIKIYEQN